MRYPKRFAAALLIAWATLCPAISALAGYGEVIVNDVTLTAPELATLAEFFGAAIPAGDYWYDPICGAWGYLGGPTEGFTLVGLPIGGPLQTDASGGGSGVFVNGREIHPLDLEALERCTPVSPGRYWLDSRGLAGYEGGPAIVDLSRICGNAGSGSGRLIDYGRVVAGDGIIGFTDSDGRSFHSGD